MFRKWWLWLVLGIVVFFVVVMFLGFMLVMLVLNSSSDSTETASSGSNQNKIALLKVDGVIGGDNFFGDSFDSELFMQQLDEIIIDNYISAIVIHVNSPGGSVVTSDELYEKILDVKEVGKKVVVSMGSIATSGGYYIAAPADYIFASRATLTGSLGVMMTLPNYQGAAEKSGYKETNITSGQFKDIGNPFRELREEERAIYQSMIDESYERFVDIIAEGRKFTRQQTYSIADGRIYSGNQALQLGLIDELGYLGNAIAYTKRLVGDESISVIDYSQPSSLSDTIDHLHSNSNQSIKKVLSSLLPNQQLEPFLMYLYRP